MSAKLITHYSLLITDYRFLSLILHFVFKNKDHDHKLFKTFFPEPGQA
jgi:hypothetical protein